jgi:hypothetical protein
MDLDVVYRDVRHREDMTMSWDEQCRLWIGPRISRGARENRQCAARSKSTKKGEIKLGDNDGGGGRGAGIGRRQR